VHDLGVGVLEDEPDPAAHRAHLRAGVQPVDQHLPVGGQHQAVEQPGEGALARPVGADHADARLGQLEVDALEHHPVAVPVPDPAQLDAATRVGDVVRCGRGTGTAEPHRVSAARRGRSMTG
jgi:hypothetical protein